MSDSRDRPYWARETGPCDVWQWIGQAFYTCDGCGWPYWHHTHEHGRPDTPFGSDPIPVIPITDEHRRACQDKWGPALAERNRKRAAEKDTNRYD